MSRAEFPFELSASQQQLVLILASAIKSMDEPVVGSILKRVMKGSNQGIGSRLLDAVEANSRSPDGREMRLRGGAGQLVVDRIHNFAELLVRVLEWSVGPADRQGQHVVVDTVADLLEGRGEPVQPPSEYEQLVVTQAASALVGAAFMMAESESLSRQFMEQLKRGGGDADRF